MCKKYKLTGDDTAADIADLLTGGKGVSQVCGSLLLPTYLIRSLLHFSP